MTQLVALKGLGFSLEEAGLLLVTGAATAHDTSRQSTGGVVQSLFGRVTERMEAASADRTTPVAHYVSSAGDTEVQVTAGYAVPADSVPGLDTYSLPAAEVASTIDHGPMAGIAAAYQALAQWAWGIAVLLGG